MPEFREGWVAPVGRAERIDAIDVVRGFALYGVLLFNTIVFTSGLMFLPPETSQSLLGRADQITMRAMSVLVSGKSMTLFTVLFGLGFAVQLGRAQARGASGLRVYLRRLAVLAGIGLCHMAFVWWADIVALYAVLGFVLVPFHRLGNRKLVVIAAVLIFVPRLLVLVPAISDLVVPDAIARGGDPAFRARVLAALSGSDYGDVVRAHVAQYLSHVAGSMAWHMPWVLGHFLLGYVIGRGGLLHEPRNHARLMRRVLIVGLAVGLACAAVFVGRAIVGVRLSAVPRAAWVLLEEVGTLALAGGYLAALTLLMERVAWRRWLIGLAPVGRMSLTNYVAGNLIAVSIFYGWGLGQIGNIGPALCVPLTMAIFAAQLVVSGWWLRRFRFGPLEWLWRSLSYGRRQPMRRADTRE